MTLTDPPTTTPEADAAPTPRGLAGLHKMSTTAGVGLQEYRALSPPAVAAVVLGVASWLALLHPLLLLVPLAAVVLGGLALAGVVRSGGTQGGALLAVVGLVLGAGFLAYAGLGDLSLRRDDARQRDDIAALARSFGEDLVKGDYRAAYDLTSEGFRGEWPFDVFRASLSQLPLVGDGNGNARYGAYVSARTNGLARLSRDPSTGRIGGEALLIVAMASSEPIRQPILLIRGQDGWRITQFGVWFKRDPKKLRQSGEEPPA